MINKYTTRCPKCSDSRKKSGQESCSVLQYQNGLSLKCFHCGYKEFIFSDDIELPEQVETVKPEFKSIPDGEFPFKDNITTFYPYYKGNEQVLLIARRVLEDGSKWIRPFSYTADGWVMSVPAGKLLYRSELLHNDDRPVLVVEGEKTADAAAVIFKNYDVVTWRGGSKNVANGDWDLLRGRKIVLWPDADETGVSAMETIGNTIISDHIYIIDVSDLPPKSDLADNFSLELIKRKLNSKKKIEADLFQGEFDPKMLQELHKRDMKYTPFGFSNMDKYVQLPPTGVVVISGRTNHGKGQPYNTPILTTSGYVQLKDLKVGDSLASVDGKESIISGIFHHTDKDTYRVTFSDGTSTRVWGDHLWEISNSHNNIRIMDTNQLKEDIKLGYRRYIPLFKGDYGRDTLNIDPYLLGALLGDGGLTTSINISTSDDFILNKISIILGNDYILNKTSTYDYRIVYTKKHKSNPLLSYIKELGLNQLSINKHIPIEVFTSSRDYRIKVLQGLLDTDGTVSKENQVSFGSSSKLLFDGFVEIARSVGLIVKVNRPKQTSHNMHYRCTITGEVTEIITLPRKLDRLKNRIRNGRKAVVSVEYIGKMDGACLKVSHPRELYITEQFIVTHNTAFMINTAVNLALHTDKIVLYLSLEFPVEELNLRMLKTIDGTSHSPTGWEDDMYFNTCLRDLSTKSSKDYYDLLLSRKLRLADNSIKVKEILEVMDKCAELGKDLVIFVDYLQIIPLENTYKNRYEQLKDMIEVIREHANKNRQLLIGGSQLTAGDTPYTDSVRESKDLENTAALHLRVWNKLKGLEKNLKMYEDIPGDIIIHVEKSRQNNANGKSFGFYSPNGCKLIPAAHESREF